MLPRWGEKHSVASNAESITYLMGSWREACAARAWSLRETAAHAVAIQRSEQHQERKSLDRCGRKLPRDDESSWPVCVFGPEKGSRNTMGWQPLDRLLVSLAMSRYRGMTRFAPPRGSRTRGRRRDSHWREDRSSTRAGTALQLALQMKALLQVILKLVDHAQCVAQQFAIQTPKLLDVNAVVRDPG